MLRVKLPHLDKWSEKRRANADSYNELFVIAGLSEGPGKTKFDEKNKVLLPKPVYKNLPNVKNYHIYNQYIIRSQKRDDLKKYLTDNEIGNEIYYPVPFHLQECYVNLNHKVGDFPEAEKASLTCLALPVYPELTNEQQQFVVQKIKEFVQG